MKKKNSTTPKSSSAVEQDSQIEDKTIDLTTEPRVDVVDEVVPQDQIVEEIAQNEAQSVLEPVVGSASELSLTTAATSTEDGPQPPLDEIELLGGSALNTVQETERKETSKDIEPPKTVLVVDVEADVATNVELVKLETLEDIYKNSSLSELKDLTRGKLTVDEIEASSRSVLLKYLNEGIRQTRSKRGNFPIDVRRPDNIKLWNATVLTDWLEDYIILPTGISTEQVWDEIYRRYKIPGNWTHDAAKDYVLTGNSAAVGPSGILIRDRQRDAKTLDQWTYFEVKCALLGEIKSKFSQSELVRQLRRRLFLNETFSEERLLKGLNETPMEATVDNTLLKTKLEEYKKHMSRYGQHLTEESAAQAQTMLYNSIRQVMAREYAEFHEGWTILLDFINENYNGIFTPEKARRGWGSLKLNGKARMFFENILTLMIHTRSVVNRRNEAKLYNMDYVLQHVPSERERNNVVTFYNS